MEDIKVFNRWSTQGITLEDAGVKDCICLDSRIVPRTDGRHMGTRFAKGKVFIVERLINKIMGVGHKGKKHYKSSGHITGKAQNASKIVEQAFTIIEQRTKKNPVEVLAKAVENAAPREEIVTIEYGGARYPKAVECAPIRRIDLALRLMTQGPYHSSFNKKKRIVDALADEIIAAYNLSSNSLAISKKLELERQADSAR
ncbi:MAG TPA: 30S ribosomal protein S7 [Candidatus Nanoarchaeia archaeon]|nr:30S ribosomal protein S7 [Candidatus Nanoarchaeia archaeon]